MIAGHGYVIATPTKTGTHSLNHLARHHPELGLTYIPSGHRMTVPEEYSHAVRHMTVRDPYERLASMFRFLHRRREGWGTAEAKQLGFHGWIEWFLSERRKFNSDSYDATVPSMFLATQAECWAIYRGLHFWKLEEIQGFLTVLNINVTMPHLNTTEGVVEFPAELLDQVWDEWAGMDCVKFGYKRRT